MVSKWDAGNHPRWRSDSLVPSTQSEKQRNKVMQNSANEARVHLAGTDERGGSGCLTVGALLMHQNNISFFQREFIRLLGNKRSDTLHLWKICMWRETRRAELQYWPLTTGQHKHNPKETITHSFLLAE